VGHSLLVEDMRVACWEGQHAEYAAVAAVCVLAYPLGVPLFLAVKLWRNRDAIKTVRARPGRLSTMSVPERCPMKIHFVWGVCMGAQGA
jgi:hypothetical protein